jgi:hypothetical protein
MGSTQQSSVLFAVFESRTKELRMNRVLLALAVGMLASSAWAQPAAPAGTGTSGPSAPQAATADAGTAAGKSDATTTSVTKQRKKAKKTTVKLGVKTGVVKQNP